MHDRAIPQAERAIIESRAMVEASRRHLAGVWRNLRGDRAFIETIRRDLDRWRRELRR